MNDSHNGLGHQRLRQHRSVRTMDKGARGRAYHIAELGGNVYVDADTTNSPAIRWRIWKQLQTTPWRIWKGRGT